MSIFTSIFSAFYSVLWCLLVPFLFVFSRLGEGWRQRLCQRVPRGPYLFWIQAASGGESYLAVQLIKEMLGHERLREKAGKILITCGTPQGMEVLQKGIDGLRAEIKTAGLAIDLCYFPIDAPIIMRRAFQRFQPQNLVIIETELWPGLLMEAKKRAVPVHLINARISEKSFRSYSKVGGFFRDFGPRTILAISDADKDRFTHLCPQALVMRMENIKFDRLEPSWKSENIQGLTADFKGFFCPERKLVLLGSIRKQEENEIVELIEKLQEKKVAIALFPKHISRAKPLLQMLQKKGIKASRRSQVGNGELYDVIVWDVFGELGAAYGLADAIFVGGSLKNLGGQNFLEPLAMGKRPIIGPYYHNFLWVGKEVFSEGLVQQVADSTELYHAIMAQLETPHGDLRPQIENYIRSKQGGSRLVVDVLSENVPLLGQIEIDEC